MFFDSEKIAVSDNKQFIELETKFSFCLYLEPNFKTYPAEDRFKTGAYSHFSTVVKIQTKHCSTSTVAALLLPLCVRGLSWGFPGDFR